MCALHTASLLKKTNTNGFYRLEMRNDTIKKELGDNFEYSLMVFPFSKLEVHLNPARYI